MNTEQFASIKRAINIIEESIKETLDLDKLSKEVGLSKYYLHRLFKSITGKSLMSYVRGRKLSLSIPWLLNSDFNIIDIANEYQFKYEQSYIRAFKQNFNMTPSQCRKRKCEIDIEQKIDINNLSSMEQGIVIKPRMCIKPEFYLQGIKSEILEPENLLFDTAKKQAIEFEDNYLSFIENKVNRNIYFGLVLNSREENYCNTYASCTEVTGTDCPAFPVFNYTIPMQQYAVFRYIGLHSPYDIAFATLDKLYNHIFEWEYSSAYNQSEDYHFEKMDMEVCSETYCEMDIYIPVC